MNDNNTNMAGNNPFSRIKSIPTHAVAGQTLEFACPACGRILKHKSDRPGNALIRCAACKSPLLLRIDTPNAQNTSKPAPKPAPTPEAKPVKAASSPAALGTPVPQNDGSFVIKEQAKPGQTTAIKCGHCGKLHVFTPKSTGRKRLTCVKCHTITQFVVEDPNAIKVATAKAPASKAADGQAADGQRHTITLRNDDPKNDIGAISVSGFMGLKRKEFRLRLGENTIGRDDKAQPSSIVFDDQFMSRQSVVIDVQQAHGSNAGFLFQLRVLNARNPVFVNKKAYHVGESVYLNYGDTLRLGHTTMRFVKAKSK